MTRDEASNLVSALTSLIDIKIRESRGDLVYYANTLDEEEAVKTALLEAFPDTSEAGTAEPVKEEIDFMALRNDITEIIEVGVRRHRKGRPKGCEL